MVKFSCCKIVRTCVMDSFRGSHRPNFLYDETFHLGISRIQNCICTYITVMTKFIFKLSFVFFFFDLQKYYILIFYSMIRKKIITHSELYFEQRIVYIVLIVYFIARSFLIQNCKCALLDDKYYKSIRMTIAIFLAQTKYSKFQFYPSLPPTQSAKNGEILQ